MPIKNDIKYHPDFLEIFQTGVFDLDDGIIIFSQILNICRLTGLKNIVIDYRELKGDRGGTAKTIYGLQVVDQYNKHLGQGGAELKFAYITPKITSYEPGAKVAEQGGFPFKQFENRNDALEWLGLKKQLTKLVNRTPKEIFGFDPE
jgi:hypothetical protein